MFQGTCGLPESILQLFEPVVYDLSFTMSLCRAGRNTVWRLSCFWEYWAYYVLPRAVSWLEFPLSY